MLQTNVELIIFMYKLINMDIKDLKDFNTLVKTVRATSEEEAGQLIKSYADIRVENAINKAWKTFRKLLNRIQNTRKLQLKKHILNYDETSGAVPLTEFVKFFAAVEDELTAHQEDQSEDVKEFAENLQDFMWNKLGTGIKIDRRIIAQ